MYRLYLYRCLLLLPSVVLALPQATSTTASTSTQTEPAFPTMAAQDGVGVPDGGVGSIQHPTAAAGADGFNQGAFSLSTGAIIGISVAIGLIIVAIGKLPSHLAHRSHLTTVQEACGLSGTWPKSDNGTSANQSDALLDASQAAKSHQNQNKKARAEEAQSTSTNQHPTHVPATPSEACDEASNPSNLHMAGWPTRRRGRAPDPERMRRGYTRLNSTHPGLSLVGNQRHLLVAGSLVPMLA